MRRALAAVLLALCLGAGPAQGAHSLRIGIADDRVLLGRPAAAAASAVARWKALGIDVVRIHVRWVTVAPAPNARHMPAGFHASDPADRRYDWGALDRAIGPLDAAGIEPMLAVTGSGPIWSSSLPSLGNPRYRPDPRGADPHSRHSAMRPLTFLRAFGCVGDRYRPLRRGSCRGFHPPLVDGIAYHPHEVLRSPSQRNPQRDEASIADLPRLETVIDRVRAHGGLRCTCPGPIPLHLTEFGYQTSPPDPYQGVAPALQARWLQEAGYRAWRDPRVKTLVQYEWRDDPLQVKGRGARAYAGWQSGLLFSDARPKPALAAFPNPFWVDARPGRSAVTVWGQVRPGTIHVVSLERRLPGRAWRSLGTLQTDAYGSFTEQLALPPSADLRFSYEVPPVGFGSARTIESQPVTVRRTLGVLPPGRRR